MELNARRLGLIEGTLAFVVGWLVRLGPSPRLDSAGNKSREAQAISLDRRLGRYFGWTVWLLQRRPGGPFGRMNRKMEGGQQMIARWVSKRNEGK